MGKITKSITVDEKTYQEIDIMCKILNRTFSNYVDSLLKEEIKKMKNAK